MHICFLSTAITPVVGGAEKTTADMIRGLSREGHKLSLLTGNRPDKPVADAIYRSGGKLKVPEQLPCPPALRWEEETFYKSREFYGLLEQEDVQVVVVCSHDAAITVSIVLGDKDRRERPTMVGVFHEMATEASNFGRARSRFVYRLNNLDHVFAGSRYYFNVAKSYGYPVERLHLVQQGISLSSWQDGCAEVGRRLIGASSEDFVVLCAARFTERKRQQDLVKALDRLNWRRRVVLVLAGSTSSGSQEYLDSTQKLIYELGLHSVVRIAEVEGGFMASVLAGADVAVLPSEHEGLGLAALEAMAAGTPVIVSNNAAFAEYCEDGQNALMFEPGDVESLAGCLRRLRFNRTLGPLLSSGGLRTAERHDARLWIRALSDELVKVAL